ncbi:unnamed protein product [Symbiodinium sp. CCMP2456]|nr:unnamed protein product [Symbiodinium sp. CCMP2456]
MVLGDCYCCAKMPDRGLEVFLGKPSENAFAGDAADVQETSELSWSVPDEAREVSMTSIPAPETSPEDIWEDPWHPVLGRHILLMTQMLATRPQVVRGIRIFRVLQGGPRDWMQGALHRLHADSEVTTSLDEFWCHSWHIHPAAKYFSVVFLNNGFAAFVVGTLSAGLAFSLCVAGLLHSAGACTLCGTGGYYLTLLLWQRWKLVFLDIACIHQTDVQVKLEGLVSIGAFLKKSRTLLVLWDPTLVSRLWCIFEMAAFLHSCEFDAQKDVKICPVLVGPVFLLGHFGLCVLMVIYAYAPVPLVPFWPWGGLLVAMLALPCLTLFAYVLLVFCSNIETMQKQVRYFKVEGSSSQCCTRNHVDPTTGQRTICDRSIIGRCITKWFGSSELFESVVRSKLLEILVDHLANRTFSYWRIVQATSPVLWSVLDLILVNVETWSNAVLSLMLYWLAVLPSIALVCIRLAYQVRLLCSGTLARVLVAVGLVTIGSVMFLSCFMLQWAVIDAVYASTSLYVESMVLSTAGLLIVAGTCTVLLWWCMPVIHISAPESLEG